MKKKLGKNPLFYLLLCLIFSSLFLMYQIIKLGIIPFKFLMIIGCSILVILSILGFLLLKSYKHLISLIVSIVLSILICFSTIFGNVYINMVYSSLNKIVQEEKYVKKTTHIYVLKTNPIETIQDLNNHKVGMMENLENNEGSVGINKKLNEENVFIKYKKYKSALEMLEDFKNGEISGILCDSAFLSTMAGTKNGKGLKEKVKSIISYEYMIEKSKANKDKVEIAVNPFNIYVSGVDTTGEIQESSRSDVNMIVSVNPNTRQILLTSIPRDYYVETCCDAEDGCAIGEYDKLTHTGLHGPDTTEKTLENLFGIKINYNVRVNFSSVVDIVDELGGITVNNPREFNMRNYHFDAGEIHLNGKEALAFCRERKSFESGDRERGKNQMRVMKGLINKVLSPKILTNFSGILKAVSNSFTTNMPLEDITQLINKQLNDGGDWEIYSYSVDGTTGMDFAYELGDYASVMYPDEETIEKAVENIVSIENGQEPVHK